MLTQAPTEWPEKTWRIFEDKSGLKPGDLGEYVTIKVIAERTEAVGKLIFYPFLILFLTIVSRSSFFDRWHWPVSLILVYGLSSLLAVYAVWQLRGAAEQARNFALARLNSKLFRAFGGKPDSPVSAETDSMAAKERPKGNVAASAGAETKADQEKAKQPPENKNLVEQLRMLIKEIESCEEGAFAPITQQPVIKALMMPFSGAGMVALLNYLAGKM